LTDGGPTDDPVLEVRPHRPPRRPDPRGPRHRRAPDPPALRLCRPAADAGPARPPHRGRGGPPPPAVRAGPGPPPQPPPGRRDAGGGRPMRPRPAPPAHPAIRARRGVTAYAWPDGRPYVRPCGPGWFLTCEDSLGCYVFVPCTRGGDPLPAGTTPAGGAS